jgi:hypothetical protein
MKVEKYATCLDMRTKMMKRTYEMLVMTSCRRMLILDGLVVDRASIKAKDKVWEELVKIGVFNTKAVDLESLNNRNEDNSRERQVVEEQSQLVQNPVREDRWHAEDSFA